MLSCEDIEHVLQAGCLLDVLITCALVACHTQRFCSMASLASLDTLTDGVILMARSWTNMSDIPESELDQHIKALQLHWLCEIVTSPSSSIIPVFPSSQTY